MGFFAKLFKRTKHHTYWTYEKDLEPDEIESNREEILSLLRSTNREGMEKVIKYMEKWDFFNLPSSIHHHHNYRGGLAQHVLSVYNRAREAHPELPNDSLIIACLLHDLCKSDNWHYDRDGGLHRNHGKSQRRGSKSIKIINDCGLQITESERLAIRWHMGGSNAHTDEMDDASKARFDHLWEALYKANRQDSQTQ